MASSQGNVAIIKLTVMDTTLGLLYDDLHVSPEDAHAPRRPQQRLRATKPLLDVDLVEFSLASQE